MKYLPLLFLLVSCNQKVLYFKKDSHSNYQRIVLGWKKNDEYRGIAATHRISGNAISVFTLVKDDCGKILFNKHLKVSSKANDNYKSFHLSLSGETLASFSKDELELLTNFKRIVDSLDWCQSDLLTEPDKLYITEIKK